MNHVFVDFENVHQVDLSMIGTKSFTFTLLLGARQTKLDAALVEKLMEHAASVQLVRLSSCGKNALDFTLAYYVGRAVMADPTAIFISCPKTQGLIH
jgi:ABC-type Fe2+-enterobactin transport system substrate-binding protein